MPDWRDEACAAVDLLIAAEKTTVLEPRWHRIGPAHPGHRSGWYTVDTRGARTELDQLDTLRLDGGSKPTPDSGYPVMEALADGMSIQVRVADFVDLPDGYLWQLRPSSLFLLQCLRDRLADVNEQSLAHQFATGVLAAVPAAGKPVAGFTDAQNEAYRSCLTPGVRLVWGPPGTGKTRVLTEAIATLTARNKRVLLVSSTNIAVDNALFGVVRRGGHAPGELVRVGPPHLREIAEDATVSLPRLVRARLSHVEAKRLDLQSQLVAMRDDIEELADLTAILKDFDPAKLARIQRAMDTAATVPALRAALATAGARLLAAQDEARLADKSTQDILDQVAATGPARQAFAEIRDLNQELDTLTRANDATARRALSAGRLRDETALKVSQAQDMGMLSRFFAGISLATLRTELAAQTQTLDGLVAQAKLEREQLARRRQEVADRSAWLSAQAGYTAADIDAVDALLAAAQQARTRAADTAEATARAEQAARSALRAAESVTAPTGPQVALVQRAQRLGLAEKRARADVLGRTVKADARSRSRLQKRYNEVQEEYENLRKDAEGEVIRDAKVVATTLARFRLSDAVFDGPYDVVLVDEVAAAFLPEVVLAVSRAVKTAVLLGDFMQLPAVVNTDAGKGAPKEVQRWLRDDAFAHCAITSTTDAIAEPGCTALDVQHRFGHDIMGLANAIAYDGLLTAGANVRRGTHDDPEIVLVDTDTLGDLGTVRSTARVTGWWPAGALLCRALADYHLARGEQVGVVTPYRPQVEATLEALRDREGTAPVLVEVGTAHRFQGREFPIVIFDLVEDGTGDRRWMASARGDRGEWERTGIRLFNVAVTRTQTRLYLVGSGTKVRQAGEATPLGQVAKLILAGKARVVTGNQLITAPTVPADQRVPVGAFGAELATILAQQVTVSDIEDESTFYAMFAQRLAEARDVIWIWAAWAATRLDTVLPLLLDAVRRGVRVIVFARGPGDPFQRRPDAQARLDSLRTAGVTVVLVHELHQKIIVIDAETVLIGSLNVLSQKQTREVMLAMHGRHFARKLLEHENAEVFAKPPVCGSCGASTIDLRRTAPKGWYWRCFAAAGDTGTRGDTGPRGEKVCGWTTPVFGPTRKPASA